MHSANEICICLISMILDMGLVDYQDLNWDEIQYFQDMDFCDLGDYYDLVDFHDLVDLVDLGDFYDLV